MFDSQGTTVLIADDHVILRQGLCALLTKQPGLHVVAEAGDGESAVRAAAEYVPDVVLMDVHMPGMGGVEATRRVLAARPTTKVIALTGHTDAGHATAMLHAGAIGYVIKDAAVTEVVEAIHAARRGQAYFSPVILGQVMDECVRTDRTPGRQLSPRETEVLRLVAEGLSTKQAARHLSVSVKTIETHRRNLMEKLQIDHVAGLTKYAIRQGMCSL